MNIVEEVPEEKGADIKYGVNVFSKEVHIEKIQLEGNFKSPDFKYVVERVHVSSDGKGNGVSSLKIYTDGELIPFRMGNWKIVPVITMPYSWQGYWVKIEMTDSKGAIYDKKDRADNATLFKKDGFSKEITWFFDTLNNLVTIANYGHLELLDLLSKIDSSLNCYKKPVSTKTFDELFDQLKMVVNMFQQVKGTLAPGTLINLKMRVNATIELFNNLDIPF